MSTAQELAQLSRLLNTPNLTTLLVTGSIVGEVQVTAIGPGPLDRVAVLIPQQTTLDLLQYAEQSWWVSAPTLRTAVENGWLILPNDQSGGGAPPATPPVAATEQDHYYIRWFALAAPNVAASGQARQYLDVNTGKLMISEGGAPFVPFIPDTTPLVLPYSASLALDFSPALSPYRQVTLTGNLTLSSLNLFAGGAISLRIIGDASPRTLTFPAWGFLGAAAPVTLAAGKRAVLSLTSWGTIDAQIDAAYAAIP